MRGRGKFILVAPALAAGTLVTSRHRLSHKFLSTDSRRKNGEINYTNIVSINGQKVYDPQTPGESHALETCYETDADKKVETAEVCGVQLKLVIYQKNDCSKADQRKAEVGACDNSAAAGSCVSLADDTELDTTFLSNALSYEIVPCEPAGEPKPIEDLGGVQGDHTPDDVVAAKSEVEGEVAQAEQDAEEIVANDQAVETSEPAPSPAPTMPPPVPDVPAEPEPVSIPTPEPPVEPMVVEEPLPEPAVSSFSVGGVVQAPPTPAPPPTIDDHLQNLVRQAQETSQHAHDFVKNIFNVGGKKWR